MSVNANYLDPKLYAAGSRASSFRTFYFEPKRETNKVRDDAVHFIAGFEHEKRNGGHWNFTRWDLVDLGQFKIKLLRRNPVRIASAILFILGATSGRVDGQAGDAAHAFSQEARKAYEQKDYAGFVEKMRAAIETRPKHQPYLYNLAAGYALIGKKAEAINLLSQAAAMGLTYPDIAHDHDFDSMRPHISVSPDKSGTRRSASLRDEFSAVLTKLAENEKPIGHSETAFVIHEKGLVPEGLAYDPTTRTFYVGSIYRRKIVSINEAGEARDFSSEAGGLWSVTGMKVDESRRVLWICSAGHPQMANAIKEEDGKSAVFKYDLRTGKLLKKYLAPDDGQKHWLGDLTLDAHGNVYASDSVSPAIYVIPKEKDEIELVCAGAPFVNPQGLAVSPDERHLLMADYLKGLFLIDLKTKKITGIPYPPETTLLGIDGIYRVKDGIVAVQNGVTPNRIVRLHLDDAWDRIKKFEVLEANNPIFDEPTLGVVANGRFYFNANSQWGAIDAQGHLAAPAKLRDAVVLSLKL